MANISYPAVVQAGFAGFISAFRCYLTEAVAWAGARADKKAELARQMVATGLVLAPLTATDQLISNAEVVTGVTVTGTGTTATFTVAGGKITAIALA